MQSQGTRMLRVRAVAEMFDVSVSAQDSVQDAGTERRQQLAEARTLSRSINAAGEVA